MGCPAVDNSSTSSSLCFLTWLKKLLLKAFMESGSASLVPKPCPRLLLRRPGLLPPVYSFLSSSGFFLSSHQLNKFKPIYSHPSRSLSSSQSAPYWVTIRDISSTGVMPSTYIPRTSYPGPQVQSMSWQGMTGSSGISSLDLDSLRSSPQSATERSMQFPLRTSLSRPMTESLFHPFFILLSFLSPLMNPIPGSLRGHCRSRGDS
ncbi:hypothetical protein BDN72DRAFT_305325 [Pluteus cervinus]|uniref:Uncharacterized protein n=1 Tax=Pluteus cervinus TaxID=181527 RepID=A0ACD3B4X5_9AGAR|nr:hypothetical protein BDN72DRAFT_305325 [Pluteus cervinus]